MPAPFFSGPLVGWSFYAALLVLLAVAAVVDLRKALIPKWLTLSMLAGGVLANVVRGALVGDALAAGDVEGRLWLFGTGNLWLGGLDGLLWALAGFGLAFVSMFLMWILGTCGGGDVKLFAAIGAWVGYLPFPFLLLGSVLALAVLLGGKLLYIALSAPASLKTQMQSATAAGRKEKGAPKRPLRMTYSLPVAIAAAVVLLWFFRVDLKLMPEKPNSPRTMVSYHAR